MMEYQSMALPYNRVLRDRQIPVNKSDMAWNWLFNKSCKSLKGILVLFKQNIHTNKTRTGFTTQMCKRSLSS